jgi:transposase
MKQRALQLIDEGWEMAEVAEVLNVSSKSIRRWGHHYETHGRVDPPSALRGRPRLMNAKAIEDLLELIRETPSLFLEEIGEWLALYHDLPISTTALHDNLRELGLTYKLLQKAAAEQDEVARAEWLLEITNLEQRREDDAAEVWTSTEWRGSFCGSYP